MEPTLTEFSYGYCVTEELANGLRTGPGIQAAPFFSSQYGEGKAGGGFDVQIGSALFLQFKLSKKLTRWSAKETKKGLLDPPFYRFWLHARNRSDQHQLLIELERQTGYQVYYVAPAFADLESLNAAYINLRVVAESAMFSPMEIGALQDEEHHRMAFRLDRPNGWFMSEPRPARIRRVTEVLDHAMSQTARPKPESASDWLYELAAKMKAIVYSRDKAIGESIPLLDGRL